MKRNHKKKPEVSLSQKIDSTSIEVDTSIKPIRRLTAKQFQEYFDEFIKKYPLSNTL